MPHTRRRCTLLLLGCALVLTACGSLSGAAAGDQTPGTAGSLHISPQNSSFLVGVNRLSVAVMQGQSTPVLGALVGFDVIGRSGIPFEHGILQPIGAGYPHIPVYLGAAKFPQAGDYKVHITADWSGNHDSGDAVITVKTASDEPHVGDRAPALAQRVSSDVHGDLTQIDSGVPPDTFHTQTVNQGLAAHRPMLLYFGQPGRCVSETCGPTIRVIEQLAQQYGARLLIEHIEIHDPANADAYSAGPITYRLQTEPWCFFVNSMGVIADRFEGPVNLQQLQQAADGTLAGNVPAVDVQIG